MITISKKRLTREPHGFSKTISRSSKAPGFSSSTQSYESVKSFSEKPPVESTAPRGGNSGGDKGGKFKLSEGTKKTLKTIGKVAIPVVGVTGLAIAGKKLYDKKKGKSEEDDKKEKSKRDILKDKDPKAFKQMQLMFSTASTNRTLTKEELYTNKGFEMVTAIVKAQNEVDKLCKKYPGFPPFKLLDATNLTDLVQYTIFDDEPEEHSWKRGMYPILTSKVLKYIPLIWDNNRKSFVWWAFIHDPDGAQVSLISPIIWLKIIIWQYVNRIAQLLPDEIDEINKFFKELMAIYGITTCAFQASDGPISGYDYNESSKKRLFNLFKGAGIGAAIGLVAGGFIGKNDTDHIMRTVLGGGAIGGTIGGLLGISLPTTRVNYRKAEILFNEVDKRVKDN